jgi:hypothetical protein
VGRLRSRDVLIGTAAVAVVVLGAWADNNLHVKSANSLAVWVSAVALMVVFVVLVRRNHRAGWFHPLALPLAVLAAMLLAAPLWVNFTHESVGLLYQPGYAPSTASPLAVAVSLPAIEGLALVLVGYILGVGGAFLLTRPVAPTVVGKERPMYRSQDMRRAGTVLIWMGAVSQLAVDYLSRGSYGANQLEYGPAAFLGSGAEAALLVGLILVTVVVTRLHGGRPDRLRDILRGREWTGLIIFIVAVALSGHRAQIIPPTVYLAWVYGSSVRAIPVRWIVAALLVVLLASSAIFNFRNHEGWSPGAPAAVMRTALSSLASPAWLTQQTVTNVPSTFSYTHGSTYLAAIEDQLPGPVTRALVGPPDGTAALVFRNIIQFTDPNEGVSESYPSEAYLNFGLAGCMFAGLFLGALMGWAWRKHQKSPTRPRDLLYPVLIAGMVYGIRSDALSQIKDVLYPMVGLWVLMGWYRLRYRPTSAPTSHITATRTE